MRQPVELNHAYRLLNHGPTVLVTASHQGHRNVMAAAWAMPLDFSPPKVAVVIDKSTYTRSLLEASQTFALQLPCRAQADLAFTVGSVEGQPLAEAGTDKLSAYGIETFDGALTGVPLIEGCVGWLECRVIPWPQVQAAHDLFLGEVVAAYADDRVFANGRWRFDQADDGLRTLHHLGHGAFLVPGQGVQGKVLEPVAKL